MTATAFPIPIPRIPNPLGGGGLGSGQVIKWIGEGITKAINAFFGDLVKAALDPLLKLLSQTLLTTPDLSSLPRVGQLWENSRQIAVAVYALLVLAAGILVMAYETVQTRHSIKEIAPRIVVGFIAANLSLILAGKAVVFANALSTGVLGQGADPKTAANTLTTLVMNAVTNGGIFLIFIGIVLACVLLALLVGYVVRVALTVILIAGAPLALMCHALPQTEGIARWWWRAFAGVLAIQLAQSLTLVAALNVFLSKNGFSFFGPTRTGLVNLIVALALFYILFKIPFWILRSVQVGNGRSLVGGIVKGVIAYKTLGALGLRGPRRGTHAPRREGGAPPRGGGRPGPGTGPGLVPVGGPRGPRPRPSAPGTLSAHGRAASQARASARAGAAGRPLVRTNQVAGLRTPRPLPAAAPTRVGGIAASGTPPRVGSARTPGAGGGAPNQIAGLRTAPRRSPTSVTPTRAAAPRPRPPERVLPPRPIDLAGRRRPHQQPRRITGGEPS